ncbi:nucleoside hydrolase [Mycobacterium kansasii]|uniref:Pyrimidine-specific ribonucleoside hydrolase RihA n=1 Tax=Mycobacterium innocens TaxID=2341083 RepID=A0A498PUW8_9MYCO|nr:MULTISPECIES: nucleoside hydrolase [Mycobacterium]KZS74623.1 nucleoside hydrolase [Mycobacterium kansasii]VBA35944.1 Pyrimidine-specific ribonucleoside hydrolase RihA [Mycobacterium innocens]
MSAVFADVDTGIDDAIALIYVLASDDADLVGIASTGGNVAVDQVCANNLGLLELCRAHDIPVSKGADHPSRGNIHGPKGLGYAELPVTDRRVTGHDAAMAWVRAAHSHRGELIGLVTGPLTNLSLALRAAPQLPKLLRRLVIVGGSFEGETTAEWNIKADPEAAAQALAAWSAEAVEPQALPIVCGLDLTRQVAMTPQILARLTAACGPSVPLTRFIEDTMRFYFESHRDRGYGYLAYLHDPLAAAIALDPELVTTRRATVDVDLTETPARGTTVPDWSGRRAPNALVGIDVDPEVFFERFIARVGTFARRVTEST